MIYYRLKNRTWIIYVALVLTSAVNLPYGQEIDPVTDDGAIKDRSSPDPVEISGDSSASADFLPESRNDSALPKDEMVTTNVKHTLRHTAVDVQKELAVCSAFLMAVETREKMLKHQLIECQNQQPLERSNGSTTMEESLEVYIQLIQQLERSLEFEREQMQQTLSHRVSMLRQNQQQLQRDNQQLQEQNEIYQKQLLKVKNELFTVRYEYHQFSEEQRQKDRYKFWWLDILRDYIWIPLGDWIQHPLWNRIVQPHLVMPVMTIATHSFHTMREHVEQYVPLLHQHAVSIGNVIFQRCIDPASHSMQRFMRTNPHMTELWTRVEALLEVSREWFRTVVSPTLSPYIVHFRVQYQWMYLAIADALYIFGNILEQWFRSKWNVRQGAGLQAAVYNVWLSIIQSIMKYIDGANTSWILVMTILLLLYMLRSRRRRYID